MFGQARGRRSRAGYLQPGFPAQAVAEDFISGLASPGAFPCPDRSPAYSVQFSRQAGDGHYLAFGTESGKLIVVDTRAEARVQRDHDGPVACRPYPRPSSSARDGLRRVWGVAQPAVVVEHRVLMNCIFDVEWLTNDRRIALACGDAKCRVQDTETQAEVVVLAGHRGSVKTVRSNPLEQSVLVTGSRDGSFALWDTRLQHQDRPAMRGVHGTPAAEWLTYNAGDKTKSRPLVCSPVEQVYCANACSSDRRKRPWSCVGSGAPRVASGKKGHARMASLSSVTAVEWLPDGRSILTAGQDGLVKLWDTRYGLLPLQETRPVEVGAGTNSGDKGSQRALNPLNPEPSGDRNACASTNAQWAGHPRQSPGRRVLGKPGKRKGRRMADPGRISGGEAVAQEASAATARPYGVSSLHACADGSRIAVCTVKNYVSVYAYHAGSLSLMNTFAGNNGTSSYYIKATLSPDGSLLASGSMDGAACLWRVDSPNAPLTRLVGHGNEVTGVDWCHSDELKLATCADDETVRVWTLDPLRVARTEPPAVSNGHLRQGYRPEPLAPAQLGSENVTALEAAYASGTPASRASPPTQGIFGPGYACAVQMKRPESMNGTGQQPLSSGPASSDSQARRIVATAEGPFSPRCIPSPALPRRSSPWACRQPNGGLPATSSALQSVNSCAPGVASLAPNDASQSQGSTRGEEPRQVLREVHPLAAGSRPRYAARTRTSASALCPPPIKKVATTPTSTNGAGFLSSVAGKSPVRQASASGAEQIQDDAGAEPVRVQGNVSAGASAGRAGSGRQIITGRYWACSGGSSAVRQLSPEHSAFGAAGASSRCAPVTTSVVLHPRTQCEAGNSGSSSSFSSAAGNVPTTWSPRGRDGRRTDSLAYGKQQQQQQRQQLPQFLNKGVGKRARSAAEPTQDSGRTLLGLWARSCGAGARDSKKREESGRPRRNSS